MTLDSRLPTRRVILLGASNLTRSFSTAVETARRLWREPVEIMAAMGHGRSYGQDSRVLGRKISGIFSCELWRHLRDRPPLPTAALVTDVGNDLLYGVPVDQLLEWVEACLNRLAEVDATVVVTGLPIGSLKQLGAARFRLCRALLFPSCRLTLSTVKDLASVVDRRLAELAARPKTSVIPASSAWYGFDPVHLRRRVRRQVWPAIMSAWRAGSEQFNVPRTSLWSSAYLAMLAPSQDELFGVRRRCEQPSGMLTDGTTISLY